MSKDEDKDLNLEQLEIKENLTEKDEEQNNKNQKTHSTAEKLEKSEKEEQLEKEEKAEKEEKLEYSKMIGNYILFDQIGMGTFSKVTRAVHILTEQIVAVKILEKEKIEDNIDVERIIREIEILKNISHPNIAQMFETYSTIHNIYLMMEYIEGGDLFDYINKNLFLPENKACYIFRQLIGVIEYLNNMGISHRDIKPENILLDKNKKNIKVIDFGLSNYCIGKTLLHSSCGSPCYASPEMLSGEPYQGITTDLWSSGIVLYSMLVGSLPFDEQELQKLYEQIKIGRFFLPSTLSLEAIDFLKRILMVDPKKRIGLKEIKNHKWFKMEKNPMYKGINIEIEEFPCNMKVASYVIKHFFKDEEDMNIDSLVDMVKTNACNKYTATYYLTKKYILCIEDKYKVIEEETETEKENNLNENKKNEDKKNMNIFLNKDNDNDDNKNKLLYSNEKLNKEKDIKNKKDKNNINNDANIDNNANVDTNKINNDNDEKNIRSKTEENQIIKNNDEKEQKKEKKNCPTIIINNNNKNKNIFEEQNNNILLTENDYYKNNKKNKNKENKKKSKQNQNQNPSNNKKQKESSKLELTNINLKNIHIITNDSKKMNKSKQKINPDKKILNFNLKSTIIKRKNVSTISNIKSLTERINEYAKKEININKINNFIDKNKKIKKKRSPPSSNNFNFYVINNIIHKDKDKQEINNEIFNIKLNHHRKNKSSSIINRKIKNIPLSKTQERINTEIGKISQKSNNKLIYINNEEYKVTNNKNKNYNTNNINNINDNSNINISKKLSNTNLIINNNIKKRRNSNSNSNKNPNVFNNNKNTNSNNYNYINTNYVNNSDKLTIKNIINIINNSNNEKRKSKINNLTLGKNLANKSEHNYLNITHNNSKNKQGNSFLVNYIKQKNLLNYISNNPSNHLKRQSHQRNFSNALKTHLSNFKTDISNKSNTASISKNKEKFGNESTMNSNPYFPTEKSANNNIFIKKGKIGDYGNNKSHHKNKVI